MTSTPTPSTPRSRLPYFSLREVLLLVTFTSVGTAGLINASTWWTQFMFTATIGALMLAVLFAVFRNGSARAFALGFAIWGGSYLTLILLPLTFKTDGLSEFGSIDGRLLTTASLQYVYEHLLPRIRERPIAQTVTLSGSGMGSGVPPGTITISTSGGIGMSSPTTTFTRAAFYPSFDNFKMVGHNLWALLLAYIGGMLAQYLARTRKAVP